MVGPGTTRCCQTSGILYKNLFKHFYSTQTTIRDITIYLFYFLDTKLYKQFYRYLPFQSQRHKNYKVYINNTQIS